MLIMAEGKKKILKASKFRSIGKYFLIVLVVALQGLLAYKIVAKNYGSIYRYGHSFIPRKPGQFQMDKIIVNPADTDGERYLLVQMSLELANKDDEALVKKNNAKIRNDLIRYLSSQTIPQLQGVEGKEYLRAKLVKIINRDIGKRSVRNLYYTKYVMQ